MASLAMVARCGPASWASRPRALITSYVRSHREPDESLHDTKGHSKPGSLHGLKRAAPRESLHGTERVAAEDLFSFLFPAGFFHCKSTARLYIFGEYGPQLVRVRNGWMSLRAGYKGQHIVTEQELADMIDEMIREDILRVYVGDAVLKPSDQEEVISQADEKLKTIPNYSKEDIEELLAPALGDDGMYDFHLMQAVIRKERAKKLADRRKMYPDIVKSDRIPPNAFSFYDEILKQSFRPKKFRDSEIFLTTSKTLSRNSFKITEGGSQGDASVAVNARVMRQETRLNTDMPSFKIPGVKNPGSHVKTHTPWKSLYWVKE